MNQVKTSLRYRFVTLHNWWYRSLGIIPKYTINSELLTIHATISVTDDNCAVPLRFAYRRKTLHRVNLKPKKFRKMKSTFSVIFYLKRQVVKKDGTVSVMGRITVDGSQTQFSCKLTVDPKLWDTKGGRVTGKSTAALEANRLLVDAHTHQQALSGNHGA